MRRRAAVVLLLAACNPPKPDGDVPPGTVEVLPDTTVVKSGPIGVKDKTDATYVFVDARNLAADERFVAIEGTLLDGSGQALGPLSLDELRVPSSEVRTFALLFGGVAPDAKSATFRVRRAAPVADPQPILVIDPTTEPDGAGLAAVCRVENTLDKNAVVTLIGTFYDERGHILGRPFVLLQLEPRSSRPFRFTGPPGSKSAHIFLGDVTF